MTKSKSFNKSPKQRALYHALMELILEDEEAMDEGVADKLKKRKQDDVDKDEGPFAGLDQGLKRQKPSKDTEPSKKAKSGNTNDQPNVKAAPKHDWFKKPKRPPTPDLDWNLMSTPIDFSAYVMNHLKIDNLTQQHLVRLAFNLLKRTCKSRVELEYNFKECYKAVTDRLDWNNPKGKEYPFDLSNPLPLIMERGCQVVPTDYCFNNDLEYLKGGSLRKKYTTSITKTKAAKYDIPGIEDMVPLLWSPIKVAYDRHAVWGTSHWGPK
ncbi:hypothetical protein Tco_1479077 [Tanacetum coccineum]